MRFRRVTMISVLLLAVFTVPTGAQSTASSVGTKIGEGISAAISTAFPAVSKILDLIWPKKADGSANTDNKKKPDAVAATNAVKADVTKGLSDLESLSHQLDVVSTFVAHCVVAENAVVAMQELLEGKSWPLAAADKLRLDTFWADAKGRIGQLSTAAQTLPALGAPSMQSVFRAVANANIAKLKQVDTAIGSNDPSAKGLLQGHLKTLDDQLSAVNALSGEVIINVAAGLRDAKNKAAGAQGVGLRSKEFKDTVKDFDTVLTKRYSALK